MLGFFSEPKSLEKAKRGGVKQRRREKGVLDLQCRPLSFKFPESAWGASKSISTTLVFLLGRSQLHISNVDLVGLCWEMLGYVGFFPLNSNQ